MARDGERLEVEEGAVTNQAAVLVQGDGVAATAAGDRADHGVLVNVDDLITQAVEAPVHSVDDDVVGAHAAEHQALDDMIVAALGRGSCGGENRQSDGGEGGSAKAGHGNSGEEASGRRNTFPQAGSTMTGAACLGG